MKKILVKVSFLLIVSLTFLITTSVYGQVDDKAVKILDEAVGFIVDGGSGAIYYESVASNLKDPLSIFTLPLYQIEKGGYWIFDGERFEMHAGGLKAICDGKLLSFVDETSKMMYVDSVRKGQMLQTNQEAPSFDGLVDKMFGDGNAIYIGEEEVKGRPCHKVKAYMEKSASEYVLYWIDIKRKQLVLMAEHTGEAFTVYEVKKVTTAPKNHNFTIVLPNKELTTFYGYEVMDMRFANQFLGQSAGE